MAEEIEQLQQKKENDSLLQNTMTFRAGAFNVREVETRRSADDKIPGKISKLKH